jgi:hypothetical protein
MMTQQGWRENDDSYGSKEDDTEKNFRPVKDDEWLT